MSSETEFATDMELQTHVPCLDCGTKVYLPVAVAKMFPRQRCDACEARARGEVPAAVKPLTPTETLEKQWAGSDDAICPPVFRDTDVDRLRKLWGGVMLERVLEWNRKSSKGFVFKARTGKGKTRLMLELFRHCHFEGMSVRVLWPEDLADLAVKAVREGEFGPVIRSLCRPQLLGVDDGLIAGASDERTQRFLLALADARYRNCRPLFLTTQVSSGEYAEAANKWGDLGPSGQKRVDALFRRLGALSTVILPEDEQVLPKVRGGSDE